MGIFSVTWASMRTSTETETGPSGWNLARRKSLLIEPTCSIKQNETKRRAVDATTFQTSQGIEYAAAASGADIDMLSIKGESLDP
ncbi:hypothetical protein V491_01393 [Pseudogymnoascus sp. VKM F-3775]|nr:hypothetical protein V491_01393 [Pseudogymnoascus sp. VKM F-3775]